MKVKLLLLLMFSGCLAGSVFAQEEVVDESASTAVGTRIGGTLKGLNRVSIGVEGGVNWLKATEGAFDAVNPNFGGIIELTGNPLWGLGVEFLYLIENHKEALRSFEGSIGDLTLYGSLNLSNLLGKYRSAGWQKLNVYALAGGGYSFYSGKTYPPKGSEKEYSNPDKLSLFPWVITAGGLLEYDISKHFALGLQGKSRIHAYEEYVGNGGGRLLLDANLLLRYKFGGEKNVRNVALVNYEPKVNATGMDKDALSAIAKKLEKRLDDQDAKIKRLEDQLKDTKDTLDQVRNRLNKIDQYLQNQSTGGSVTGTVNFFRIQFDTGKDFVKSTYFSSLDGLVNLMKQYPDWKVSLKGYTDSTGSVAGNLKLSKERANAVKDYMVKKGASAGNINAEGFGVADPIANNNTAAGRAQNRRVDVELLQK